MPESVFIDLTGDFAPKGINPQAVLGRYTQRVLAGSGEVEATAQALLALDEIKLLNPAPSLVLSPSGKKATKLYSQLPEDGSGDFTVARASNTAVRVNKNGYYEPVVANVPRLNYDIATGKWILLVEPAATNLVTYPRAFAHRTYVQSNAVISADPSTEGVELVTNGNFTGGATGWLFGAGWAYGANNMVATSASGVLYTNIAHTIGKTYKVVVTLSNVTSGSLGMQIGGSDVTATIGNSNGTFTVYFCPNSAGATYFFASNFSGIVDDISIKEVIGFDCPFVNSSGINIKQGFLLTATGANGYIRAQPTVVNATAYTNSIFIKRVTGTGAVNLIGVDDSSNSITLTTEWQRFSVTKNSTSTTGNIGVRLATSGDVVMICFAQLELGSVATSPIYAAVEGSSETRNADVILKTGANALIGQTEGTILIELKLPIKRENDICSLNRNSTNTIIIYTSATVIGFRIYANGGIINEIITTYNANTLYKIACIYKSGSSKFIINGLKIGEISNSFSFSLPLYDIHVNQPIPYFFGVSPKQVKSFCLIKSAISESQAIALTTL
jgi:hypothetical protein